MGIRASKVQIAALEAAGATVGPMTRLPGDPFLVRLDRLVQRIDHHHQNPQVPTISHQEWTIRIHDWMPTPLNKILYSRHWTTGSKHKKSDGEIVAYYGRNVPKAAGKRSVSLHVVFPPKRRMPDVDAYAKSLLDCLVSCGILVNDSSKWCVLEPVSYSRGDALISFVTIKDIA